MALPERQTFVSLQKERFLNLSKLRPADVAFSSTYSNKLEIFQDSQNCRFVKKTLSYDGEFNHATLIDSLSKEYPAIGFSGTIRGRDMKEQAAYMRRGAHLGLAIVPPLYEDALSLVYPYIEGEMLETKLQQGSTEEIIPTLNSLHHAHRLGFSYGDRHPGNVLVQPDRSIIHIDFEVDVVGQHVKELELMYMLYGIAAYTTKFEETVALFEQFARGKRGNYDWEIVATLLQNYDAYLTAHPNIKTTINRLQDKVTTVTQALLEIDNA